MLIIREHSLAHSQVGEQQGFHDNGTAGKGGTEETGGHGVQSAPLSLALQVKCTFLHKGTININDADIALN